MNHLQNFREWLFHTPMDHVEEQQVRQWFAYVPVYATALTILFIIAFIALWGHVPTVYLSIFIIVFFVEGGIKSSFLGTYKKATAEQQKKPRWRVVIIFGTLYSGIVYGLASLVMLYPMPDANLHVVIGVYAGIFCIIAASTTNHLASAYLLTVFYLLPLPVALLFSDSSMHLLLAAVIALVALVTLYSFHKTSNSLNRLIVLNAENVRLVEQISSQKNTSDFHRASAEKAVIDKSKFIAEASHELRQPLHAIGLFQGLIREKNNNPETEKLLDHVDSSTESLRQLFDSLLDISRLDARSIKPEIQPVPLHKVFEQIRSEYLSVAENKGLTLHIVKTALVVITDKTLLMRILRNLVSNAIRYSNSGTVTLQATETGTERAGVAISVTDNGIGIAEQHIETIFNEFSQLDHPDINTNQGIGLGLAIVRRICNLLSLPLQVNSTPGHGTQFRLEFPAGIESPETQTQQLPVSADLTNLKIMLIDDHVETLLAMQRTLQQWHCEASVFSSRLAALESEITPDLILCDYRLRSGNTGVSAVHQLHQKYGREIPAIIITADTSKSVINVLKDSGLHYLHKPVTPNQLFHEICQVMQPPPKKNEPEQA
jgi:signal transduction histidine kinase/CheY-like chemotaxis protein